MFIHVLGQIATNVTKQQEQQQSHIITKKPHIKVKKQCIGLHGNPLQSHGASLAIWDHTVLPATRHKWTRRAITPVNQASTRFTYSGRMKGWVDLGSLIAARPEIEPTTAWLQVRRPNRYATEPPNSHKYDHGLTNARRNELHWLHMSERIQFRTAVTVHHWLNGFAGVRLFCVLWQHRDNQDTSLVSNQLAVPTAKSPNYVLIPFLCPGKVSGTIYTTI